MVPSSCGLYSDAPVHGTLAIAVAPPNSNNFGPQVPLAARRQGVEPHFRYRCRNSGVCLRKDGSVIGGFAIQDTTGKPQPDIYLDGITLLPDMSLPPAPTAATISVSVDAGSRAASDQLADLRNRASSRKSMAKSWHIGANRWGGNGNSRFNWKLNANNACPRLGVSEWQQQRQYRQAARALVADEFVSGNTAAAERSVRSDASPRSAGYRRTLTVTTVRWTFRSRAVPRSPTWIAARSRDTIRADNRERTSVRGPWPA